MTRAQDRGVIAGWEIDPGDGRVCEIKVGRGIAEEVAKHPQSASRLALFTQPTVRAVAEQVAANVADAGGVGVHIKDLPDGDTAKSMGAVEEAYEWLNSLAFNRDDYIIAVGGGALTDVVGFTAATYLRGVEVAYLPTTLLGAVDAAIGGKTGINVGGKNLAGVFRHPRRVIVDLDLLDGLPQGLLIEGAAETVKAGFIADGEIVAAYEKDGLAAPLDTVVPAAIAVKVATVQTDFREAGRRAILNYGHTIGHAVELAASIPHGHAVAIGMVAAGKIAEHAVGFADSDRQRRLIEHLGLPTGSPPVDREVIVRLLGRDKKRDQFGLRMVLLERFGSPVVRHVGLAEIEAGLREVGIS